MSIQSQARFTNHSLESVSLGSAPELQVLVSAREDGRQMGYLAFAVAKLQDQHFLYGKGKELSEIEAICLETEESLWGALPPDTARKSVKQGIQKLSFYEEALSRIEQEILGIVPEDEAHLTLAGSASYVLKIPGEASIDATVSGMKEKVLELRERIENSIQTLTKHGMQYPTPVQELKDLAIPNVNDLEWSYGMLPSFSNFSKHYKRVASHLDELNAIVKHLNALSMQYASEGAGRREGQIDEIELKWKLQDVKGIHSFVLNKINGVSKVILLNLEDHKKVFETDASTISKMHIFERAYMQLAQERHMGTLNEDIPLFKDISSKLSLNPSYFGSIERTSQIASIVKAMLPPALEAPKLPVEESKEREPVAITHSTTSRANSSLPSALDL